MNRNDKEGIAFGEAIRMSSPPNRSQIEVKLESGFGGWADEKTKTAREAVPHLGWEKSHPQHLTVALFKLAV
jgi:imidazoleglycerol phosphate synthase glutamine amidotransferase subunit HisH